MLMEKNSAGLPSDLCFDCYIKKVRMKNGLKLVIAIAVPLGVGALAAYFTSAGVNTWYRIIEKPAWNPPDAVFAPVWTTLYILMGVACYLIWKRNASPGQKQRAIAF